MIRLTPGQWKFLSIFMLLPCVGGIAATVWVLVRGEGVACLPFVVLALFGAFMAVVFGRAARSGR